MLQEENALDKRQRNKGVGEDRKAGNDKQKKSLFAVRQEKE